MTITTAPVTDYSDQTGIFDPSQVSTTITIIGCGGIGASILPTLLTMGLRSFVLYDGDYVEPRNLSTNLIFRPQDLYRSKVDRVKEYLEEYGENVTVTAHQEHYVDQPLSGIVISGVDSMAARKLIWENLADNDDVILYMDGRIGGQFMQLFCLEPLIGDRNDEYAKHNLFRDEDASELPCTERTVVYPAVALGTLMASYLSKWQRGQPVPFMSNLHFGGEIPQMVFIQ